MTLRGGLPLALALCLSAAPAMAQDAIVVEGERLETADIRSQARDITVGWRETQFPLARFQLPVCPGVWGMTEENARIVLDRIVENAIAADIPVNQEPNCQANIWVAVVDDVEANFARLREEDSWMTRHLTDSQVRQVQSQEGPTRGWNFITTRNPDTGLRLPDGFEHAGQFNSGLGWGTGVPVNRITSASRLELGVRTDIELSFLLIERRAVADIDAFAVADYATMRLLAHTKPPSREDGVGTVLTLFSQEDGEGTPQRMTVFDRAYLRSLYRSHPTRPARIALGNISGAMENLSAGTDQ